MKRADTRILGLRMDPKLIERFKVYVLKLGRPWTASKLVSELIERELREKKTAV